jgi:sortase A
MRDWRMLAAGVVTAGAVIVFATTLAHATLFAPDSEIPAPALSAAAPSKDAPAGALPVRLIIPSLNINANVQDVGIAYSGHIGVPNNFTDVAWYKYGAVPGYEGDAIIDGHVDNAISLPGVFKQLATIQPGADIYVQTASSTKLDFKVTSVETYDVTQVPMQQILSKTGGAYLTLITCDGTWEQNQKEYNERLVVSAELAP